MGPVRNGEKSAANDHLSSINAGAGIEITVPTQMPIQEPTSTLGGIGL